MTYVRIMLVAAMLLFTGLASAQGMNGAPLDVRLSESPDRSGSIELSGAQVSGQIYVFAESSISSDLISSVVFLLNGIVVQTERVYHYDLGGSARRGLANPFDTTRLSDGFHQITTQLILTNGEVIEQQADFSVNNEGGTTGVDPLDRAPTAVLMATPNRGIAPLRVIIDGTASSDDSAIEAYEWTFGDGNSQTLTTSIGMTEYEYSEPGTYLLTLRVLDDTGNYSESVSTSITVDEGSPPQRLTVRINEFLAKNDSGLLDDNGELEDWIELYNYGDTSVNLLGWCLSDDEDDPTQWCFEEDVSLGANEFLVIIAGGDVNTTAPLYFHTSFGLSAGGEFLGLYEPGNPMPVDVYNPFPPQEADQSYGKSANGESAFLLPTPNAENQEAPPRTFGTLRFNLESVTSYGNNRSVTLTSDNGSIGPYSLTVSDDSASWLVARGASSGGVAVSADMVELFIDPAGLEAGSYIGVVTAEADGVEASNVTVNLIVPSASATVSDWEVADVRFSGLALPIDLEDKRVFYSVGPGFSIESTLSGLISYNDAAGFSVGFNMEPALANNSTFTFSDASYASEFSVQIYKDQIFVDSYDLVLTNLPLVSMKAETIVNEPERPGVFQFVSGESSESTAFYNMGVEFRGGTAQQFPKKPYKIEFVDTPDLDTADGLDVQFPGLRDDDDWILDAAYRDTTFVRNLVSMDIWNELRGHAYIDEQGRAEGQPALKGGLVEVVLDNQYQGVHVLQERLDRKLLEITQGSDSALFKADSNFATLEFISSVRTDFEQDYPDYPEIDSYSVLEDLISFVNNSTDQQFVSGIGELVDIDSVVDYWLFNLVTMANDNLKKNYFLYRNETGKLIFTPWDFDATFGMHWSGRVYGNDEYWAPDQSAIGGWCTVAEQPNCNFLISRLSSVSTQFNEILRDRWNELKTTTYSVDSLSGRFREYHDQLTPIPSSDANAFIRNSARWPNSGGEGRNNPELGQIDWITNWISERWDFVDRRLSCDDVACSD